MLWHLALSLSIAALALATTLHPRDGQAILDALNLINLGLQRIDIAILGLQNGTGPALARLAAASVPVIQNATAVVAASAPVTPLESQSLFAGLEAIRMNLNLTIIDSIKQKPLFDTLNLTATFAGGFAALRVATTAFTTALGDKLPIEARDSAEALAELDGIFQLGTDFFNGVDTGLATELPPLAPFTLAPLPDLSPVTILPPMATQAPVAAGQGMLNMDGSCDCAVTCPARSFNMGGSA